MARCRGNLSPNRRGMMTYTCTHMHTNTHTHTHTHTDVILLLIINLLYYFNETSHVAEQLMFSSGPSESLWTDCCTFCTPEQQVCRETPDSNLSHSPHSQSGCEDGLSSRLKGSDEGHTRVPAAGETVRTQHSWCHLC